MNFCIRIYALVVNESKEILLSDEYMYSMRMTKFPGGGLEFGEGILDCLKREAIEEFGQPIEIISHFYTTDYYQKAMFHENAQLISIYYTARFPEPIRFKISHQPYDFSENSTICQSFRWKKIENLTQQDFTFPTDQKVAEMLKQAVR
jgi:8-oxo-dGTP diphosphatase